MEAPTLVIWAYLLWVILFPWLSDVCPSWCFVLLKNTYSDIVKEIYLSPNTFNILTPMSSIIPFSFNEMPLPIFPPHIHSFGPPAHLPQGAREALPKICFLQCSNHPRQKIIAPTWYLYQLIWNLAYVTLEYYPHNI